MRVIFMGTPEFSVPVLEALAARHQVVCVYAQPPRPAGRGKALRPSLPNASHRQFLPLLVPSKHSGADRKSQGRFRPFSICGIIRQAGWKEGLRCQRYFRGCVP